MRLRPPPSLHSKLPPYGSSRPGLLRRLAGALAGLTILLWALPLTLLGLLVALPVLCWRGRARIVSIPGTALLVSGPVADFLLARHPFGAMSAMAIGHVVIEDSRGLSMRILTHELEHVRQAAVWGVLFPFVYLGASLWALLRGRDAYWHNAFEIAARRAEIHH
jgi:hypothetical protein